MNSSLKSYFRFICTNCKKKIEQNAPSETKFYIVFEPDGAYIPHKHEACGPCARLIDEANIIAEKRIDDEALIREAWKPPAGSAAAIKLAKAPTADAVTEETASSGDALSQIATALLSLSQGQERIIEALNSKDKTDGRPKATTKSRRTSR